MKHLFLIALLLLSSVPASAEWVWLGEGKDPEMTIYVDPETVRRKEDLVKMWELIDFKSPLIAAGLTSLSTKVQKEYDCAEERYRLLAFARFSGNMGKGDLVYNSNDEGKWELIVPGSIGEAVWKVVCGKQ